MNYQETVEWMFQQLPMFQQIGAKAYKNDLTNIINFSDYLHHPEKNFKTIHVAGTNGKGSTSSMLASIFKERGLKVGLYTSPHLKDYRERITINGVQIEEEFVVEFIEKNKPFLEKNHLSFFEMSVGLAFDYFSAKNVDIAVIEVGLGGRLDATNIITPLLSIITSIGLDHQEFLGNTLEKIAFEKAGIIKHKIPVVIGETKPETLPVFQKIATANESELYLSEQQNFTEYESDLKGDYQKQNKQTVRTAIEVLNKKHHFQIEEHHIVNGFLNVRKNSGLRGRWEILNTQPLVIADCAHNKHGLEAVIEQLNKMNFHTIHFVLGFVKEKDLDSILPLFPKNGKYYFTQPNNKRALDASILKEEAQKHGLIGNCYATIEQALTTAKENAKTNECVYIGGSTFVVAEIL
ncbi:MAG: bifunctional folylpolyglutamate synthase/dihydrofolate synthase [Flavobacterium sp.]